MKYSMHNLAFVPVITFLFLLYGTCSQQFCPNYSSSLCFNCYYRCQTCTQATQNNCTSCIQSYVLIDSQCLPCGNNCLFCQYTTANSTDLPTNYLRCETCFQGFYLSQESGVCNPCPVGAVACTFSAVQQCGDNFYLLNSACFKCLSMCKACLTSPQLCDSCMDGYYVNSLGSCSPCQIANCLQCSSSPKMCSQCVDSYTGNDCESKCPSNCKICLASTCYECLDSYYLSGGGTCQASGILCSTSSGIFDS